MRKSTDDRAGPEGPAREKAGDKIGFGERLKKARGTMSGTVFGIGLGDRPGKDASRQTISDWEAERHYPSVRQLYLACLKLGKGADELLFGRTNPFADEQLAIAAKAVGQLTAQQRADLFEMMARPGVSDATVEEQMPITRRAKH